MPPMKVFYSIKCTIICNFYYKCRSDVLGQFMPMVGVDWSQNGVAHLFSAIKVCNYYISSPDLAQDTGN